MGFFLLTLTCVTMSWRVPGASKVETDDLMEISENVSEGIPPLHLQVIWTPLIHNIININIRLAYK